MVKMPTYCPFQKRKRVAEPHTFGGAVYAPDQVLCKLKYGSDGKGHRAPTLGSGCDHVGDEENCGLLKQNQKPVPSPDVVKEKK